MHGRCGGNIVDGDKMNKRACAAMVFTLMLPPVSGMVVASDDIDALGKTLTPWGAIKAANADGTIPAYSGGIQPPAEYDPAKPGIRPDPFQDEKPRLVITADNMAQYEDNLSEGIKEMLRRYPTFRLDVYPTHRTARYPDYIVENTLKNARECRLAENRLQLEGNCYGGVPFPLPKNGSEVMWNRSLKFETYSYHSPQQVSTLVDSSGRRQLTGEFVYWAEFPHYDPNKTTPIAKDALLEIGRNDWTGPTRKAGEMLVLHDSVDMLDTGRLVWSYLPGQRRVKLSPDVAYDTPSVSGGGVGTVDDSQVFYGSQDRYDYRLVGRKEVFIPYNTFKLQNPEFCSDAQVFTPNHLNPDCVRWELHRVWVVEATLKDGKRHVYPRRVFYWDEDFPGVGIGDNYDQGGSIYRVTQINQYPFYESYGNNTQEFVVHDLASGAYVRQAYVPAGRPGMRAIDPMPSGFYQPSALSAGGVR